MFVKGQSGNPLGRKPGTKNIAVARAYQTCAEQKFYPFEEAIKLYKSLGNDKESAKLKVQLLKDMYPFVASKLREIDAPVATPEASVAAAAATADLLKELQGEMDGAGTNQTSDSPGLGDGVSPA